MQQDYVNFSQEKCKGLIRTYQQTKDSEIFSLLLAKYDRYLAYVLHKLRRDWAYLKSQQPQDLYHTAILGFYKAIKVFNCDLKPEMILLVIKAYIKSEFKQTYSYKIREVNMTDLPAGIEEALQDRRNDALALYTALDAGFVLASETLTGKEWEVLTGAYLHGHSTQELSISIGVSKKRISKRLYTGLKKLKLTFAKDIGGSNVSSDYK